jgi:hypothetical protein
VSHEGASGVRLRRDVRRLHPPAVDRQRAKWTDASAWIPGRAVDDSRVISKRSRGGDDDEVLIVRLTRTNDPSPPGFSATFRAAWADDVQFTASDGSSRDEIPRNSRWTRNRVANVVGRRPAFPTKFRRCSNERRRPLSGPLRHRTLVPMGTAGACYRREPDGQNEGSHLSSLRAFESQGSAPRGIQELALRDCDKPNVKGYAELKTGRCPCNRFGSVHE